MPTRAQVGTTPPAQRGPLTAWRRLTQGRAALVALAATAALGAAASPASAVEWGYEQISPADSTSLDVVGLGASNDMSMVVATTKQTPLLGYLSDGRGGTFTYGLPRGGTPWSLGPVDVFNYSQIVTYVRGISADGSRGLVGASFPSVDGAGGGLYRVDAQGGAVNATGTLGAAAFDSSDDLGTVAIQAAGTSVAASIYVSTPAHNAPVVASVDNTGASMTANNLGDAYNTDLGYSSNAVAADGSSVIFSSVDGIPGDNDGGALDVYMRVLTPGAEKTIEISDATPDGGADPANDAHYRWATADHQRVFFITDEGLAPGDTDGEQDIYLRDGTGTPVWISQGETVDGAPTGNAGSAGQIVDRPQWVLSSQDGNRTFFTTTERLTQDAPADGMKLYERDVAEGRTRFVAGPLDVNDVTLANSELDRGNFLKISEPDINFRGLRVTPDGAVFMSAAPLDGVDTGDVSVFVWRRGKGLERIVKPDADAPPMTSRGATLLPSNLTPDPHQRKPSKAGRAMSDDGSRVFFTTGWSLTAQDTDGGYADVYEWTAAGGLRLVTPPGRAPYDAAYIDNSPDGSQVYFSTEESILPSDTDPNAIDVYLAILGGGSAPGKPGPDADPEVCTGDACQGPVVGLTPPSIGSVSFAGSGNVPASPDPVAPSVSVSKLEAVSGSVATLKVRVPDAGRISVAGGSLRTVSVQAAKAGSYSVKIALSSAAKRSLKRKKTLKVSARVTYQADNGDRASKTVSVSFKQPKAKPAKTKKGGR